MKKINSTLELKEAIRLLENDRAIKLEVLKLEVKAVAQSLKPENLIKNSIKNIIDSPTIKQDLLNGAIGLATGYLSKKILTGNKESGFLKNILGNIIQFGVARLVSKNAEDIKFKGYHFIKNFLSKK